LLACLEAGSLSSCSCHASCSHLAFAKRFYSFFFAFGFWVLFVAVSASSCGKRFH
jgi:hypothetical protein